MPIRIITTARLRALETELATARQQSAAEPTVVPEDQPPCPPAGVERVILTEAGLALADRTLVVWEFPYNYQDSYRPWQCQGCGTTNKTDIVVRGSEHARSCRALPRPSA